MFARAVLEILKEDKEKADSIQLEKQQNSLDQMYLRNKMMKGKSIQEVVSEQAEEIHSKFGPKRLDSGLISKPAQFNAIRSKRYHIHNQSLMTFPTREVFPTMEKIPEYPKPGTMKIQTREIFPTMAKIPVYPKSGEIPSRKNLIPAKIPGIKTVTKAVWKTRQVIDFPSKMEVMSGKDSERSLDRSEGLIESTIVPKLDEKASFRKVNKQRIQERGVVMRGNLHFQKDFRFRFYSEKSLPSPLL